MNKQGLFKLSLVAALCGVLGLSYFLNPLFFQTFAELLAKGDVKSTLDFLRSYGPYAMVVSFAIVVFINTLGFLPNIFFLAANGILFGIVWGTVISWLAECVGATISFLLMRYLFKDSAQELIQKNAALKQIDDFSGAKGFQIMLITRAIPYIPSGLITALGALSSITLKDYVAATLIGKLPSAWVEVTIGHDLMNASENGWRIGILIAISTVAYVWYWRSNRKKQTR